MQYVVGTGIFSGVLLPVDLWGADIIRLPEPPIPTGY
jgi:hypothetical protein